MNQHRSFYRRAAAWLLGSIFCAASSGVHSDSPGEEIYRKHCAGCHDTGPPVPRLATIQKMSRKQISNTLRFGKMKMQAASLSQAQLMQLLHFLKQEDPLAAEDIESGMCEPRQSITTPLQALVGQWGFDSRNTRFQPTAQAGITRGNLQNLRLKWVFGIPGATTARAQPVITTDTVFLSTTPGNLFALDRHSGCIKWIYRSEGPLRTAVALGTIPATGKPALFFAGHGAVVFALDPLSGQLIWRKEIRELFSSSMITGAPVQHRNRLFVPVSSSEVGMASDPNYECCRTHGGVVALNADNGETLWVTRMAEPARRTFKNRAGVQQWGPSGAPVWTTPTVDAKRGLIYVGTGENYSSPANEFSDAIVALAMDSGAVEWVYQATAHDAYNMACVYALEGTELVKLNGPNCPPEDGPDVDFGASVIITATSNGKDILLAGQKSGEIHALDPDRSGRILWRKKISGGSMLGGVHWGMSASGKRLFAPLADPELPVPGYLAEPGLVALSIDDGKTLWRKKVERGCTFDLATWAAANQKNYNPWPDCGFYYGLSAAVSSAPGLVFTGSLDGRVRIYGEEDGALLWEYDTVREFETVNGIEAHGGAIDNAGVQVAGGMLFVQSGYAVFDQMPGNALLVFEVDSAAAGVGTKK